MCVEGINIVCPSGYLFDINLSECQGLINGITEGNPEEMKIAKIRILEETMEGAISWAIPHLAPYRLEWSTLPKAEGILNLKVSRKGMR